MEKKYYVMTAGGLTPVNNLTENYGYKVLGPYKLWNPRPLTIGPEELSIIRKQLPEWLMKKYPNDSIEFSFLKTLKDSELINKFSYIYTIFWAGENDVYLLRLKKEKKIYKIYFLRDRDPEYKIVIKDQEWMSMLDDPSDALSPEQKKLGL